MTAILLVVIYIAFIGLGVPDSLIGNLVSGVSEWKVGTITSLPFTCWAYFSVVACSAFFDTIFTIMAFKN